LSPVAVVMKTHQAKILLLTLHIVPPHAHTQPGVENGWCFRSLSLAFLGTGLTLFLLYRTCWCWAGLLLCQGRCGPRWAPRWCQRQCKWRLPKPATVDQLPPPPPTTTTTTRACPPDRVWSPAKCPCYVAGAKPLAAAEWAAGGRWWWAGLASSWHRAGHGAQAGALGSARCPARGAHPAHHSVDRLGGWVPTQWQRWWGGLCAPALAPSTPWHLGRRRTGHHLPQQCWCRHWRRWCWRRSYSGDMWSWGRGRGRWSCRSRCWCCCW
jgi:hypothetical protein